LIVYAAGNQNPRESAFQDLFLSQDRKMAIVLPAALGTAPIGDVTSNTPGTAAAQDPCVNIPLLLQVAPHRQAFHVKQFDDLHRLCPVHPSTNAGLKFR
jgi:hypothetical protein